jgi:hypothetical protein
VNSGSAADGRENCAGLKSTPNRYRVVLFLSILAYHGIDKNLKTRFINPLSFRKRSPVQAGAGSTSTAIA